MSQINNTGMLEMMRGTPPPTWEQTCLKLSEEKRELQSDVNELKELVEYLQDRIKKLKMAGDVMHDSCFERSARLKWAEVKGVKP